MTALLDADVIVYRSIFPAHAVVDWDGEGAVEMNNLPAAKQIAVDTVRHWTKLAKQKRALLIFSDRSKEMASFRYHVHPHYKGNRTGPKPPMHEEIHHFLCDTFKSHSVKDLEGDDTMGLMATNDPKYTIVSIDKDMLTLPARVVNPMDKEPQPRKISVREADYNWMYQTICGDTVDNFKGAPGAGDKAAQAALAGITNKGQLFQAAYDVFVTQMSKPGKAEKFVNQTGDKHAGGTFSVDPFAEFLMNARCARILRVGDYDQKEHKVKLWHPDATKTKWIDPYFEEPEVTDAA